ncbi:DUF2178 domain-containing protein [Salinirubellus salinus]|uniref:DUF2178 domain-containing protein n=1 Tax=Salinirubellus salinus TaxID=1364945 RepID=A0A9E7QZN7_9EURY|nr:DUF2178 domain-containing protein [Salinirubellus salinus]UWM52873.1 DUF2178 domain-containing protein [Salinirubellus salinus]
MTETATPTVTPRRTYVGLWAVGTALYVALLLAGQVLAGVAAFALFGVGALAYHRTRQRPMLDERDASVLETASANTVRLLGVGSAVVFPSTAALDALGYVTWPAWLTPVGLFLGAFWAVWVANVALTGR